MGDFNPPRWTRCPHCPLGDTFKVDIRGWGPITWFCADCRTRWPRFPEGTAEHAASMADIAQWGAR